MLGDWRYQRSKDRFPFGTTRTIFAMDLPHDADDSLAWRALLPPLPPWWASRRVSGTIPPTLVSASWPIYMKPTSSTTCQLEFASEHRCFAMMQHHSWLLMNRGTQPWYLKEGSHGVSRRHAKGLGGGSTCCLWNGLDSTWHLSRQVFPSRGARARVEKCEIAARTSLKKRHPSYHSMTCGRVREARPGAAIYHQDVRSACLLLSYTSCCDIDCERSRLRCGFYPCPSLMTGAQMGALGTAVRSHECRQDEVPFALFVAPCLVCVCVCTRASVRSGQGQQQQQTVLLKRAIFSSVINHPPRPSRCQPGQWGGLP